MWIAPAARITSRVARTVCRLLCALGANSTPVTIRVGLEGAAVCFRKSLVGALRPDQKASMRLRLISPMREGGWSGGNEVMFRTEPSPKIPSIVPGMVPWPSEFAFVTGVEASLLPCSPSNNS